MSKSFLKTALLLTALTVLLVGLEQAVAGTVGMVVALIFAALMNFFAYWFSDRIVLNMSGARELAYEDAPDLYRIVGQVAQWAGVPRPRIYPFDGRGLQSLFMTHPPIPDRVERLRAMAIRARVGY